MEISSHLGIHSTLYEQLKALGHPGKLRFRYSPCPQAHCIDRVEDHRNECSCLRSGRERGLELLLNDGHLDLQNGTSYDPNVFQAPVITSRFYNKRVLNL